MATDPRDPRFFDVLRQLGNDDQVTGGGLSALPLPKTEPRLPYDLSGSLDPRNVNFPSQDGRMIFYQPARGIIIPDRIKNALNDVAEDFFYRTSSPLVINSGRRNPVRQARAMYRKFKGNVFEDYAGGPLGNEIIDVYKHAASGKYNEKQIVDAMTRAIKNQVDRGKFVSPHLRDNAVDIL